MVWPLSNLTSETSSFVVPVKLFPCIECINQRDFAVFWYSVIRLHNFTHSQLAVCSPGNWHLFFLHLHSPQYLLRHLSSFLLTYEIPVFIIEPNIPLWLSIPARPLQCNLIYPLPFYVQYVGCVCLFGSRAIIHSVFNCCVVYTVKLHMLEERAGTGWCLFYDIWSPGVKFWIVFYPHFNSICSLQWSSNYIRLYADWNSSRF